MPIKHIQIRNMARFDTFEAALPMVAIIQGGNGAGKTGLLDCIRFLGESGHDPDILRGNSPEGETVITLDDDTQLRVRVTPAETWRGWRPAGGRRWLKGREEIDRIYRSLAYDPLKFLELKPKDQAETLAQLSPVQATAEEITAAVGDADEEAGAAKLRPGMAGLEVINSIHQAVYEARRTVNVAADTQDKHAAELERALPAAGEAGEDWAARAERLVAEKMALIEEETAEVSAIGNRFQASKDSAQAGFRGTADLINADIDAKIRALEAGPARSRFLSSSCSACLSSSAATRGGCRRCYAIAAKRAS